MTRTTLLASLEEAILDAVENPEVEVDNLADFDSQVESIDSVQDEIEAGENAVEALESLHNLISSIGTEEFTPVHTRFTINGISAALAGLGVSVETSQRLYRSLENHSGSKEYALESVTDGIKKVMKGLKDMIMKLITKIKSFFGFSAKKSEEVEKTVEETIKKAESKPEVLNAKVEVEVVKEEPTKAKIFKFNDKPVEDDNGDERTVKGGDVSIFATKHSIFDDNIASLIEEDKELGVECALTINEFIKETLGLALPEIAKQAQSFSKKFTAIAVKKKQIASKLNSIIGSSEKLYLKGGFAITYNARAVDGTYTDYVSNIDNVVKELNNIDYEGEFSHHYFQLYFGSARVIMTPVIKFKYQEYDPNIPSTMTVDVRGLKDDLLIANKRMKAARAESPEFRKIINETEALCNKLKEDDVYKQMMFSSVIIFVNSMLDVEKNAKHVRFHTAYSIVNCLSNIMKLEDFPTEGELA